MWPKGIKSGDHKTESKMKAAIQTAPQPRLRGSVGKQRPQIISQQPKVGLENQQPKVQQPLVADQQLTHEAKGHEEVQAAGEQERMQRAPIECRIKSRNWKQALLMHDGNP